MYNIINIQYISSTTVLYVYYIYYILYYIIYYIVLYMLLYTVY